jgi:hypothetical protein
LTAFASPDGTFAAGAAVLSFTVPNFGSAEAMLATPAMSRMAALEARRRWIRRPFIANSPGESGETALKTLAGWVQGAPNRVIESKPKIASRSLK